MTGLANASRAPQRLARPELAAWRHLPRHEQSSALTASDHDRLRPGLNHLAFHVGGRASVDALTTAGPVHGWTLPFPETHPRAGGKDHCAAYLANTDGFEVELVADDET